MLYFRFLTDLASVATAIGHLFCFDKKTLLKWIFINKVLAQIKNLLAFLYLFWPQNNLYRHFLLLFWIDFAIALQAVLLTRALKRQMGAFEKFFGALFKVVI